MPAPVRYPSGVNTAAKNTTLWDYPLPDPSRQVVYWDDFMQYVAGDWTVNETQAGATQALGDALGGVLVLTNTTTDNDLNSVQRVGEAFLPAAGKRFWMKTRFKLSAASVGDALVGICVTDTSPIATLPTDGIFFYKEDGGTGVDLYVRKDATTGSTSVADIANVAADTYVTLGLYFDGSRYVEYFVNDVHKGTLDLTTSPAAYLPDTECRVVIAEQQGDTNAGVLTIDYILVAQDR